MQNSRPNAGASRFRTGLAALSGLVATISAATLLFAEPAAIPSAAGVARAATFRPAPSLILPGWQAPGAWARGVDEDSATSEPSNAFRGSFVASPGSLRPALVVQIPEQIVGRMTREARRLQPGALPTAWSPMILADSLAEAEMSRQAERVITRSFRRSLDQRLDAIAAATPGIGSTLAMLQGLGMTLRRHGSGDPGRLADTEPGAIDQPRFTGSARLRLDAHPRIQLGAEYLKFRGRIDLPLLSGDPLRLTLDRELTPRSAARLSGGMERDGHRWATLGFTVAF